MPDDTWKLRAEIERIRGELNQITVVNQTLNSQVETLKSENSILKSSSKKSSKQASAVQASHVSIDSSSASKTQKTNKISTVEKDRFEKQIKDLTQEKDAMKSYHSA